MSSGNTEVYKRASDAWELEFEVAVSHLTGVLGTEPGTLQEEEVIFTTEPSPQPYCHDLRRCYITESHT